MATTLQAIMDKGLYYPVVRLVSAIGLEPKVILTNELQRRSEYNVLRFEGDVVVPKGAHIQKPLIVGGSLWVNGTVDEIVSVDGNIINYGTIGVVKSCGSEENYLDNGGVIFGDVHCLGEFRNQLGGVMEGFLFAHEVQSHGGVFEEDIFIRKNGSFKMCDFKSRKENPVVRIVYVENQPTVAHCTGRAVLEQFDPENEEHVDMLRQHNKRMNLPTEEEMLHDEVPASGEAEIEEVDDDLAFSSDDSVPAELTQGFEEVTHEALVGEDPAGDEVVAQEETVISAPTPAPNPATPTAKSAATPVGSDASELIKVVMNLLEGKGAKVNEQVSEALRASGVVNAHLIQKVVIYLSGGSTAQEGVETQPLSNLTEEEAQALRLEVETAQMTMRHLIDEVLAIVHRSVSAQEQLVALEEEEQKLNQVREEIAGIYPHLLARLNELASTLRDQPRQDADDGEQGEEGQ